jgi:hypothetical protein
MKTIVSALIAATLAASSANALANVDVSYLGIASPGSTITLQVHVSVAPSDGTDTSLYGSLIYPTSGIGPVAPGTQIPFSGMFSAPALTCNTSRCLMFSQTSGLNGPQSGNAANQLIAAQNYTISLSTPAGTVLEWHWVTTPTTHHVDFFNFSNAQAPVPALSITVIPEPTTAALLGLGLLGLVAGSRGHR